MTIQFKDKGDTRSIFGDLESAVDEVIDRAEAAERMAEDLQDTVNRQSREIENLRAENERLEDRISELEEGGE